MVNHAKPLVAALVIAALLSGCTADLLRVTVPATPVTSSPTPSNSAPSQTPGPSLTATPSPSIIPDPVKPVVLKSVVNFRDAADGVPSMAKGVVYRAAKLSTISKEDKLVLVELGITNIYDLRTPEVASRTPDPKIGDAKNTLINLYASATGPTQPTSSVKAAKSFAKKQERLFVTDLGRRRAMSTMLKSISKAKGPVIIHCTEGKDRTGWTAAVLELTAGATPEQVIEQYLLSNEYRAEIIAERYAKEKKAKGTDYADARRALAEVDESYLKAGLTQMQTSYGGIDGYLRDGLSLSDSTITKLKEKLTQSEAAA